MPIRTKRRKKQIFKHFTRRAKQVRKQLRRRPTSGKGLGLGTGGIMSDVGRLQARNTRIKKAFGK